MSTENIDEVDEEKVEEFVNNFVFDYLGQEVEFLSVAEFGEEDEVELTEDELREAYSRANKLLIKIRDHIYRD